jgi:hypothetical protein
MHQRSIRNIALLTLASLLLLAMTYNGHTLYLPVVSRMPTLTATPTEPAMLSYDLSVQAFHDYDGDSRRDEGDPPLQGVVNSTNGLECTTAADGRCYLGEVPMGTYTISIDSAHSSIGARTFLFSTNSVGNPRDGITVHVGGDAICNVALGQGPLPLPMKQGQGFGGVGTWFKSATAPTHEGLDLRVEGHGDQPVFANISGVVQSVYADCNHVTLEVRRSDIGFNANVGMGHLTSVVVTAGQKVEKGDIIGYINPDLYDGTNVIACTDNPHVHYNAYMPIDYPDKAWSDVWSSYDPSLLAPKLGDPRPVD